MLLTSRELSKERFCIHSGVRLDVAAKWGLQGECDFLLTRTPPLPIVQAPIMTVVEAKKNDIVEGLGQCAAQMLGAQLFNQRESQSLCPIFGCVTMGESWQLLQLLDDVVIIDSQRYYINEGERILGVLAAIVLATDEL